MVTRSPWVQSSLPHLASPRPAWPDCHSANTEVGAQPQVALGFCSFPLETQPLAAPDALGVTPILAPSQQSRVCVFFSKQAFTFLDLFHLRAVPAPISSPPLSSHPFTL